jgi:phage terminase large subunit-like protein
MEKGLIALPREAPYLAQLRHELLAFPEGRYDDQVDALTQFLDWLTSRRGHGYLDRDPVSGRPTGRPRPGGRRPRR